MELRGSITILREKRLEDAPQDYQWRTDAELAKLDAAVPLRVPYEEYLRHYKEELRHPTPWSRRMAILTLDGKHIGNCMYYDIDTINQEAELGIMIGDKQYWSQGYGYDAIVTLVDHIFSTTSLRRIYLHTLEWNHRARRCFEKCGFQTVRPVRRTGYNFILMELYKDRWLQIREEKLAARPRPRTPEGGDASPGAVTKPVEAQGATD